MPDAAFTAAGSQLLVADVRMSRVLKAVCSLLQSPADLDKLLRMLVALEKHAGSWEGAWPPATWAPFSNAMRHLQQHHTLEAGSLLAVQLGFKALERATAHLDFRKLHAIHHLAQGDHKRSLPLPLLLLLGVSVDEAGLPNKAILGGDGEGVPAQDAGQGPALPMALGQSSQWTKEVQQQRLRVVRGLVAAGASYSWEGPDGATVLSLAAEVQEPAFLRALLTRPNALQAFTPEQVSAALVAAASKDNWAQGCLLLEAAAGPQAPPSAAVNSECSVFQGPQLIALQQQIIAFKQLRRHSALTQQQLQ
jgi:hypothetical protein